MPVIESCPPVAAEVGSPPDPSLLTQPEFKEVFEGIAEQAVHSAAYSESELQTGEAAKRAMLNLGCKACSLSAECSVRSRLQQNIDARAETAELANKITMLATAPDWLTAARLHKDDTDANRMSALQLAELLNNEPQLEQALTDGSLNIDTLLGGVENSFAGTYHRGELPEIAAITAIGEDVPLAAHTITTKNNDVFTVIDASRKIDFKESPITASSYSILTSKLLHKMSEHDQNGDPQILNADGTMQKYLNLGKNGNTPVAYEMRMAGKGRLYFTLSPDEPGSVRRIVILGTHGESEVAQKHFFDNVLRHS